MDPMIDFVRSRTSDLQRTADHVHRERDLRTLVTPPVSVAVSVAGRRLVEPAGPAVPAEPVRDPCTPKATARNAA